MTQLTQVPKHYTKSSNNKRVKKKVKLSKNLACQLQIILIDEDNASIQEPVYEHWVEEMSTDSLVDDEKEQKEAMEEEEEEEVAKEENEASLLNPELNKSIHLMEESSKRDQPVENNTKKKAPLIQLNPPPEQDNNNKKPLPPSPSSPLPQQPKPVSGLKRLFSIGNNSNNSMKKDKIVNEEENNRQYHVLRIFSGNINVGAMFATVAVTPEMSADQLLKLALEKFHIPLLDTTRASSIEYYLTVKSMDNGTL